MSDLTTSIESIVSEVTDAQSNVEEIETYVNYASGNLSGVEDSLTDILAGVVEIETERDELETERDELRDKLTAMENTTIQKVKAQIVLLLERNNQQRETLHEVGSTLHSVGVVVQNLIHDSLTIADSFTNQDDNTDDS